MPPRNSGPGPFRRAIPGARGLARLCLVLALLAGDAGGGFACGPGQTAVFWRDAPLDDAAGQPAGQAPALSALPLTAREGQRLRVELPDGRQAWAEAEAAVVLPGAPAGHRQRLERLAQARLSPQNARRLAAGEIQAGDGQREVELAWGRPRRSYMVNLFQDEEHYVYRDQDGAPILLRFKAGRLQEAPAQRPSWVAGDEGGR